MFMLVQNDSISSHCFCFTLILKYEMKVTNETLLWRKLREYTTTKSCSVEGALYPYTHIHLDKGAESHLHGHGSYPVPSYLVQLHVCYYFSMISPLFNFRELIHA